MQSVNLARKGGARFSFQGRSELRWSQGQAASSQDASFKGMQPRLRKPITREDVGGGKHWLDQRSGA